MKVMLSGASGFIGRVLVPCLIEMGVQLTLLCRTGSALSNKDTDFVYVDSFSAEHLMHVDMTGFDCFIHLAATAHITNSNSSNLLHDFRDINTLATINLAKLAAAHNVKRFVFLSSIGVYGDMTTAPVKFTDPPCPLDAYSVSKLEAESGLKCVSKETGLDVVIIRSPLVYGHNAPGKFGSLVRLVSKKIPLPFGAIRNKRSFVSVHNLVDLILVCIKHPNAANNTFLVSDDDDISTTDLIILLRNSLLLQPMLIPVPVGVMCFLARLVGKEHILRRLCSDFEIDVSHTKEVLGWVPPLNVKQGINKCFPDDKN